MYSEASIKLRSPKNMYQTRVETADEVSKKFDKCFTQDIGAMNRGVISDSSFIVSFKRRPMKKEAIRKNAKGLIKKTSDEKEATPKNAKGLVQNTSDEKRATPQNAKGLVQKTSDEKRGTSQNTKGLVQDV
jgi:hypothetical protein